MKRYQIAGLTVDMETSGRSLLQAQPYRRDSDGPADMVLSCDAAMMLEKNPELGDLDTAEYAAMGLIFARKLLAFNGSYVHASAVVAQGKAYLFSAPSGTGKSTHTEKWCRLFGATYLNDDKPVLRLVDGVWMAYGTPWSGKKDLSSPVGVPLGGIAFLQRGEENQISPIPASEAVYLFMSQSQWRLGRQEMEAQLSLADDLLQRVPIWKLTCRNDDEAAMTAYRAMTACHRD